MSAHVALLGTGLMGSRMARNLLKAGHSVRVWNRTREKAEPLGADGASVCDTAAEAVADCEFVITMLADGPTVRGLVFDGGVAEAMEAGSVLVDMSSIRPGEARKHAEMLSERGIEHLDAPVSGGTRGAEAGSLAIMAGGEQAVVDRARPVLEAMGRPVRVGPAGAGQLSKLANQAIVAVTIGVVAEATLLAQKGGADPAALRDALRGGFADSTILQQHGERMSEGDFKPGGLSRSQLKDLDNVADAADRIGLELPLVEQARARFATLVNEMDGAELDHSALYLELLARNGLRE